MTNSTVSLAKRLLEFSTVSWGDLDRLELSKMKDGISFADLRRLEASGSISVEAISSSNDPNVQGAYDNGGSGECDQDFRLLIRVSRQLNKLVVARDLSDLLSIDGAKSRLPNAYILTHDTHGANAVFDYSDGEVDGGFPVHILAYHSAVELWRILLDHSQWESPSGALFFFGVRKLEIKPSYQLADLAGIHSAIDIVDQFISNPDRNETRKEIFASALSEFLRDQNPDDAYSYLLKRSERFARRLQEGLALFLSENSPEKLVEEGQKQHFELAEKLEKAVNVVELKALSIPISLLLVVKQAENGSGFTVVNTIMLTAVIMYWLAMTIAHSSHLTTLRLVRKRMDQAVQDLEDRGLQEANPLLGVEFASLRLRRRNCYIGAWVIWTFCFTPIIAVLFTAFISQA